MRSHDPQKPSQSRPSSEQRRPDPRHALGRLGEDLAATHLERRGFAIVDRNARTRYGEIDLIAFDGVVLAFVEVKTRRASTQSGRHLPAPLEGLRPRQRARLRRLAAAWLAERTSPLLARELRFDAIGVVVDETGSVLRLDHVEGAW
ncbi:MAG: YraN family protein [Solirubrobacteraceae bacterium]